MKRRIALKQLGLITAGAMILPSCVKESRKVSIVLKNIAITGDQEVLLADVVGTIIPTTDIPGATDLKIHEFVLRMVDDCHDMESQQKFVTGLSQVDEVTKIRFDKLFSECSAAERLALFGELEEKKEDDEKKEVEKMNDGKENRLSAFYSIAKRHTIRGYLSSEYIMTNVLVHNMIPGRYNGCIEIKDRSDIQTVIG